MINTIPVAQGFEMNERSVFYQDWLKKEVRCSTQCS